jgi:hypothetical protein
VRRATNRQGAVPGNAMSFCPQFTVTSTPAATARSAHRTLSTPERVAGQGALQMRKKRALTASGAATLLDRSNPSVLQKPFVLLDQRSSRGEWLERQSSHCLAFA